MCPNLSGMKNQQIKVNLEADIKQWLESQAAKRHCSVSQVVLDLILVAKAAETK